MCGISGYLDLSGAPADPHIAEAMAAAIAHRGPDGQGVHADGPLALGHRRLAILDLTDAGRQPMATTDGRFVIVYNGEVYNFRELRRELEALGHVFRSRTDTEVVLAAWAEWGPVALDRFNGMFAFAIWDRKEATLWLARDRYGIKPLYWTRIGRIVAFGSEIKALLQHPGITAEIDLAGMVEYFTFQNFFSERTLFAGISMLPAGCVLRLSSGSSHEPRLDRYWDYDFREPDGMATEADHADELDHLFRQAVNRQLVSDVGVGAYLSGGIDSGSITAIAAQHFPNLKSFTVGFDMSSASGLEQFSDERPNAERMSYLFATEHYEMVLKAGDMERCIGDLVWHLEEPRVGQSYPNYYAARLASRFGKVVLSGTGGDRTLRRLSVALLPRGGERRFRALHRQVLSLLAAADTEPSPARSVPTGRGQDWGCLDPRHLPGHLRDARRCTHASRGLCQPLSLSRSQDLPARPSGGRGQAVHVSLPRNPSAISRQ